MVTVWSGFLSGVVMIGWGETGVGTGKLSGGVDGTGSGGLPAISATAVSKRVIRCKRLCKSSAWWKLVWQLWQVKRLGSFADPQNGQMILLFMISPSADNW